MVKRVLAAVTAFLMLGFLSPVYAAPANTASRAAEAKNSVVANRQEMLTKFAGRVVSRISAHLSRADRLVERIQSRINKLKEKGANTTPAQAQLSSARSKISLAKEDVAKFEADAPGIISGNQPKVAFQMLRARIQTLKKELVDIHTHLASTMGLVKGLSNQAKMEKEGTESGR